MRGLSSKISWRRNGRFTTEYKFDLEVMTIKFELLKQNDSKQIKIYGLRAHSQSVVTNNDKTYSILMIDSLQVTINHILLYKMN
jgi:hypothetical protein